MDRDRTQRYHMTPETSRSIFGLLFQHGLMKLAQEEETEDEELNIEESMVKMWKRFSLWGMTQNTIINLSEWNSLRKIEENDSVE
jgi:hypothetical protein